MRAPTVVLALLLAGCGSGEDAAVQSPERADAAAAQVPAAAGAAAVAAEPAPEAEQLALDFHGDALAWMQANARSAPPALRQAADQEIQATATAEACSRVPDGDRVFVADLDGDGQPEGIALWTLESCGGGGNNFDRHLALLRPAGDGWAVFHRSILGTALSGNRSILEIGAGKLVVGSSGDPSDNDAPPETIDVPAAAT